MNRRDVAPQQRIQTMAFDQLTDRSREILRLIVENYVTTGEPIGSRTLSRRLAMNLSPASIRNVMADLEDLGLLYAPHTSAGRLPTHAGLRLFVDGLLEVGNLSLGERETIDVRCSAAGRSVEEVMADATGLLSELSRCAGLVFAPKTDAGVKHIEFVQVGEGRTLVVMVTADGLVENRVIALPPGTPASALAEATNYLNSRFAGCSVAEMRRLIHQEIESDRATLNEVASRVVEAGLATWAGGDARPMLIVRGQSHLLEDVNAIGDLERVRALLDVLETKEGMVRLLELTEAGEGVHIFIGAETQLFGLTDCSMIVAPFANSRKQIVGAVGVVGPTRINYARIIPMVDYTSQVMSRLIG